MKAKYILLLLTLSFVMSGCATYNANKDPVYRAYLNGEISYGDYVNHYHKVMAGQRERARMFQRSMQQIADDIAPEPKSRYRVRPDYIGGYTIEEE